jgi:hypothetical protein
MSKKRAHAAIAKRDPAPSARNLDKAAGHNSPQEKSPTVALNPGHPGSPTYEHPLITYLKKYMYSLLNFQDLIFGHLHLILYN